MQHSITWTAAEPLWKTAISAGDSSANLAQTLSTRRAALHRPTILRFATDDFMTDLLETLERAPQKLPELVARPETWRKPAATPQKTKPAAAVVTHHLRKLNQGVARKFINGAANSATNSATAAIAVSAAANQIAQTKKQPLKLYQPAHQRFYLVASCLVCEQTGLPDRKINKNAGEKTGFVIRRLLPPDAIKPNEPLPPIDASWREHAFVQTEHGAKWQPIAGDAPDLVENEEQNSLFAMNFTTDDGRRRIFAGVIPTGKREALMCAGVAPINQNGQTTVEKPVDFRISLMRSQLHDPWKNLLQTAAFAKTAINDKPDNKEQPQADKDDLLKTARETVQTVSWLILLDFADFLDEHLPLVWRSLKGEAVQLQPNETKLKNAIVNTNLKAEFVAELIQKAIIKTVKLSLGDALIAVKSNANTAKNLEAATVSYYRDKANQQYPNFLFPLADPNFDLHVNFGAGETQIDEAKINEFGRIVEAALQENPVLENVVTPTPLAAQIPFDMRAGWFVVRCVFERPGCAPFETAILSEPTEAFQIAGFFDSDAPARPIRIALPLDPTPAGLRKFDKNTAFMMSDLLCGQVNRMKGITFGDLIRTVLPFPVHKGLDVPDAGGCKTDGGLEIGMMCSLSIPIITICALILLMLIIGLLDFIFRWMPFFMICFPLPGLKSKEEEA